MIRGFFILLAFQLVGEVAARGLALPAPGPVIGLALLVVALGLYQRWRPLDEEALAASDLGQAARGLLAALAAAVRAGGRRRGAISRPSCASRAWRWRRRSSSRPSRRCIATVGVFLLVKRLTGAKGEA